MIRYRYGRSTWEIDIRHRTSMRYRWGYRYGIWVIDMEHGISIWVSTISTFRRYSHPGCRYGIWSSDVGDDRIDMVMLHIDMGYLVTLAENGRSERP
jgi:hypothetical protein